MNKMLLMITFDAAGVASFMFNIDGKIILFERNGELTMAMIDYARNNGTIDGSVYDSIKSLWSSTAFDCKTQTDNWTELDNAYQQIKNILSQLV